MAIAPNKGATRNSGDRGKGSVAEEENITSSLQV
jgi:hypothetical protein